MPQLLGPLVGASEWVKFKVHRDPSPRRRPGLKLPSLNFIMWHYIYMITMAIVGSILLYPAGGLAYVDALFFASGAATQSGLNTKDVNLLCTYQQVVLMLIACITNPVFIHTFVVFVRLYWFEKRFQNLVREARSLRRTRTRSRTKSEARADMDLDREERGVGGREIVVPRDPDGHVRGYKLEDEKDVTIKPKEAAEATVDDSSNSTSTGTERDESDREANGLGLPVRVQSDDARAQPPAFHRDIKFADEVRLPQSRTNNMERLPEQRSRDQHIAFIQNQRDIKHEGILRIPGPRDFDRGDLPTRLDEDEGEDMDRPLSYDVGPAGTERGGPACRDAPSELNWDDHPMKSHITIEDQDREHGRLGEGLANFRLNKPDRATTVDSNLGLRQRGRTRTFTSFLTARSERSQERDPMPYLSYAATVGRNSTFVDLTEEQREELGGIEYRSLKTLAFVLLSYFIGLHLFGMVVLLPWITSAEKYRSIVADVGQSPAWWGVFTPASMFNDLGFTLTPDSMISFQTATLPLLIGTFLIIAGNTGFPCFLRFVIWVASKCVPRGSGVWEELHFLLDHPRRCFTLLFPSKATWWLFAILVLLNGIDVILFIVLDLNNPVVTSVGPWYRFLDGLFQAASTRTAGFACVNLAALHPAIQVSYLIMMYISVFPIAISVRRTNVYEERSLGIYAGGEDAGNEGHETSYIGAHLRRQLSFDLWYIFLGLFFIAIIEGDRLQDISKYAFTTFSCLFEIVSAYGTVGLSLGYPDINASFSAELRTLSKLIIVAMMIRGRHRGLPYALDRAVLLPSETLHKKEQEDATRRAQRRHSNLSDMGDVGGLRNTATTSATPLGRRPSDLSQTQPTRVRSNGLRRIISGALSAGPIHRHH